MPNATVRANAQAMPEDRAALVAQARELIVKVRANGHDIRLDPGFSFLLGVDKRSKDAPLVQGKGLISFAVGVDLSPYEAIFVRPDRDAIFAEALREG